MRTLYLDLASGISGDMFLGALIDLGVDPRKLERELSKLKLGGYHLHIARRQRSGIEGVKFDVHLTVEHKQEVRSSGFSRSGPPESGTPNKRSRHHHDHSRNFAKIRRLIERSKLSPWVRRKAVAVFQRIAAAEGKIHGLPPGRVHFHEVGARKFRSAETPKTMSHRSLFHPWNADKSPAFQASRSPGALRSQS